MGILFEPVCSPRFDFDEFANAKRIYTQKIHKESFSPIDMEGKVVEMAKQYTNSTPCILGECPRKTKENLLAVAYCGKPYICYPCGRIF